MKCWTTKMLIEALSYNQDGQVLPDIEAGKLEFNSRDVKPGDIFIALKGENGDGHDYIADAAARKAAVIICQEGREVEGPVCLRVADTNKALTQLAQYKRQHSNARFIAITGSVGKTTTKEALKQMLSRFGIVHANKSSFNNHLGVPLTLASIPLECDYVINEMGMNNPGELLELSNLAKPDIAIITNVSFSHAGNFSSVEAIADSKSEIFAGLNKQGGMVILNKDCQYYARCKQNALDAAIVNISSFGLQGSGAELQYSLQEREGVNCYGFAVETNGTRFSVELSGVPQHLAANFAACLQVARLLGLDISLALDEISTFQPLLGRGKLMSISGQLGNFEVIADYYNASPTSVIAGLCNLAGHSTEHKIAVLGDMLELGQMSKNLHISLKEVISLQKIKDVILVGPQMHYLYEAMQAEGFKGRLLHFTDAQSLCAAASGLFNGGELMLIKGSRGIQLEKLAKTLGAEHVF